MTDRLWRNSSYDERLWKMSRKIIPVDEHKNMYDPHSIQYTNKHKSHI